ncbi:hypothetical protein ATCC90586_003538 [Pythium insidiosum]|nr:hypothetical protein ATCC90586_003538 [Pythium insidiosum]
MDRRAATSSSQRPPSHSKPAGGASGDGPGDDPDDARCVMAHRLLAAVRRDAAADRRLQALAASSGARHSLRHNKAEQQFKQLALWTQRLAELQLLVVHCAQIRLACAARLWRRVERLLARLETDARPPQQLAALETELPAIAKKAAELVRRCASASAVSPSPSPSPSPPPAALSSSSSSTAASFKLRVRRDVAAPERVELTHQWIPRILASIASSVEHEAGAGRAGTPLLRAVWRILAVVRDENPFFFLQVLYRAPPSPSDARDWRVPARLDARVTAVVALLTPSMETLEALARWMARPDQSFWASFARVLQVARQLAVAFHHVLLVLYGVAMGRADADAHVTADVVREQIHATLARLTPDANVQRYGLSRALLDAADPIVKEGVRFFPEALVYVDQWRFERDGWDFGFAPAHRMRDFEVGFKTWDRSLTWRDLQRHLERLGAAWRATRLGTRGFDGLSFAQLGELELEVKYRLGAVLDLFYRQHLAKWAQNRCHSARMRALLEQVFMADDDGDGDGGGGGGAAAAAGAGAFRPPTTRASRRRRRRPSPDRERPHPERGSDSESDSSDCETDSSERATRPTRSGSEPAAGRSLGQICGRLEAREPLDEAAILRWTDDDIDAHELETERVYELQAAVLRGRDALALPALLADSPSDKSAADIDAAHSVAGFAAAVGAQTLSRALLGGCRDVRRRVTTPLVAASEAIALHGAAETLIQRPSMRIHAADKRASLDELMAMVHATRTRLEGAIELGDGDEHGGRRIDSELVDMAQQTQRLLAAALQEMPRS